MQFVIRCAVLLSALALMVPAFAADEKKPEKKPEKPEKTEKPEKPDPKDKDKDKMIPAGQMVGKVTKLEEAGKYFALQITVKEAYVNGRNISYRDKNVDVPLQFADGCKVRLASPPPAFDDKGNPKKYTSKELRDLKGGIPQGYPGDMSNLKNNQVVRVHLAKPKQTSKPKTTVAKKDKDKDKEEMDALSENRAFVTMIEILGEPAK